MGRRIAVGVCSIMIALWTLGFDGARRYAVDVTSDIVFTHARGEPLGLDVYSPAAGEAHPVVMLVHGGSWKGGDKADFASVGERLAAEGFVSFSVNYRLVSPAARMPATAPVDDLRAAYRWITRNATLFGGDPERIGVLGSSAGGHLALLLARRSSPKALAAWSPPIDLAALLESSLRDEIVSYMGCDHDACPGSYEAMSPAARPDLSRPPVFFAYSSDEFIPLTQAEALVERLEADGTRYEERTIEGTRHGLQLATDLLPDTIAFFRDHLARSD